MPETTTTYDFKDVEAKLLVLTAGTELLKAVSFDDKSKLDVRLVVTKKD